MGSLVFDRCYPDLSSAADAYFSGKGPAFTAGVTSYQSWFEKVSGVWYVKRESIDSGGVVTALASSVATVPAFPACDQMAMMDDGIAVGWLIVGVMVIAWGWRKVGEQAK